LAKIIATINLTLDGIMEGPPEDPAVAHQAWAFPYWDDAFHAAELEHLRGGDAFLLGRVSYEGFASVWPSMTDFGEYADILNGRPKHVASTTLSEPLAWNARLLTGDLTNAVSDLRRQYERDILIQGSGTLAHSLRQRGLIDVFRLILYPVVLGRGRRYFVESPDLTGLHLAETREFAKGIIILTYTKEKA
jgi:dihydrofolate reductase